MRQIPNIRIPGGRPCADALATVVGVGMLLMCCGFYFFPDYGGVARVFYLLVLLPAIPGVAWCWPRQIINWRWMLVYLLPAAYLALSVAWSPEAGTGERSVWYLCKPVLFLAGLYLACCALSLPGDWDRRLEILLKCIVLTGLVTAVMSLWMYVGTGMASGKWDRLSGMSLRGDINVTAALYGLNCLVCAWAISRWERGWRLCALASMSVAALVIVLSRSKVPLLGLGLAMAWLLRLAWTEHRLRRVLLLAIPLVALLPLAYFISQQRIPFLDRPAGYLVRLEIWPQAVDQWLLRPWFGHGVGSNLPLDSSLNPELDSHVHNVWLGTLRYGGLVGVCLLSLQWLLAAVQARRLMLAEPNAAPLVVWLAYGVFFLLTNGQQPLVKPHHIWLFYWIPLALLLARAASINAPGGKGVSGSENNPVRSPVSGRN